MKPDSFDRLFDEAFDNAASKLPAEGVPDYRPSWEAVRKKLDKAKRRKSFRKRMQRIGIVAASLAIGAILFGNLPATKAFDPIYQYMIQLPDGVIGAVFGKTQNEDGAKTAPPPSPGEAGSIPEGGVIEGSDMSPTASHTVRLTPEEAEGKTLFDLPAFGFLPVGYRLQQLDLTFHGEASKADYAQYVFINEDDRLMYVIMQLMTDDFAVGGSLANPSATMKEVKTSSGTGYLTQVTDGTIKLELLRGNLYISLTGAGISEEDIMKVEKEMFAKR